MVIRKIVQLYFYFLQVNLRIFKTLVIKRAPYKSEQLVTEFPSSFFGIANVNYVTYVKIIGHYEQRDINFY